MDKNTDKSPDKVQRRSTVHFNQAAGASSGRPGSPVSPTQSKMQLLAAKKINPTTTPALRNKEMRQTSQLAAHPGDNIKQQKQRAPDSKKKDSRSQESSNMSALKDVVSSYQQLKSEWTKKPPNLEKCGQLLSKLKVGLTNLMFLPTSNMSAPQQELLVARDVLEIGAQHSIAVKDIPSFERYMAQLKCYYLDYRDQLPESAYKYQLLGLNLLFLLSQNRVAEFHTELELLPADQIQTNVYIRHPLSLEQYLMEGSYNKIFLAKGNVPAESYNFFIDILLDTIRSEIAACLEKAYEKISLNEAARMLNFPNQAAIVEYGKKKNWVLGRDNFYHFGTEEKKVEDPLPSTELAEQALEYARELEMIV